MRVFGVLAAGLAMTTACGEDVPAPPVTLEERAEIPVLSEFLDAAFDRDDTLVVMDGTGLRRLVGTRLDLVPNSGEFAQGTFGVDRDGTLLVGSLFSSSLARLDGAPVFLTPVPAQFEAPVGTPAGAYWIRVRGATTSMVLPPGMTMWTQNSLDLSRTLRAPDGTRYAIVDGDVVRMGADDTLEIIASCAEFGGATCGRAQLAGLDADGHIALADVGARGVPFLDPVAGTFRFVELPASLLVIDARASVQGTVAAARDPDRDNQRSLWFLAPGAAAFERFHTLPELSGGELRLLADGDGTLFLADAGKLNEVVVE